MIRFPLHAAAASPLVHFPARPRPSAPPRTTYLCHRETDRPTRDRRLHHHDIAVSLSSIVFVVERANVRASTVFAVVGGIAGRVAAVIAAVQVQASGSAEAAADVAHGPTKRRSIIGGGGGNERTNERRSCILLPRDPSRRSFF